jgi:uncharacterized protein
MHVLDNRSRKTRGKVDRARSEAADHGNAEAQFQLGHLYAVGQGLEHDYPESRHWIRQATLQGHEQALRELKRREYRDP